MRKLKEKYRYLEIEKVTNGYIVKNISVTAVFNSLEEMLNWIEEHMIVGEEND